MLEGRRLLSKQEIPCPTQRSSSPNKVAQILTISAPTVLDSRLAEPNPAVTIAAVVGPPADSARMTPTALLDRLAVLRTTTPALAANSQEVTTAAAVAHQVDLAKMIPMALADRPVEHNQAATTAAVVEPLEG